MSLKSEIKLKTNNRLICRSNPIECVMIELSPTSVSNIIHDRCLFSNMFSYILFVATPLTLLLAV